MKHVRLGMYVGSICLAALVANGKDYAVFDVVGDSVSVGVNPDYYSPYTYYGWVQMLFGEGGGSLPSPQTDTLNSLWPGIVKYNGAQSGSKASDWSSTSTAMLNSVLNHHPDLVVVMIGGNDFIAYGADGVVTSTEIAAYRQNLETIVDRLQANSPKPDVILVDYYDLADGFSSNLPSSLSTYRQSSTAAIEGNQVIHDIAEQKGAYFVSIYNSFYHHAYGQSLGDTQHQTPDYFRTPLSLFDIHPVTSGHQKIYSLVYQKLAELKNGRLAVNSWALYSD